MGAWGIGWQVMFDGLEISQFTYFQQAGGLELSPISAELTYGLERIAMALQRVDSIFDIEWSPGVTYRDVRHRDEVEGSKYVFGQVDLPAGELGPLTGICSTGTYPLCRVAAEFRINLACAGALPQVFASLPTFSTRATDIGVTERSFLHPAGPAARHWHRKSLRSGDSSRRCLA